ncbi:MAG: OmpA family protein [Myxococcota bacterium]|nr:OmpA family protein [Myxococcota bacterium]
MKTISTLGFLMAFAGTAACASAMPPPELASARTAYDRAARGPAASLNPTDLHTAKESLDAAEQSFNKEGDTAVTRDLGYTAERRTEAAEARARTMQVMADKEQVIAQMHANTATQGKMTAAQLGRANQQIASQGQALQAQGAALQTEVQRREDAEKRAAQAAADLAKFASVKQEARGMVITLSGSVLFTSAKSDLLPTAQAKLNDVAKALTEQDPDSKMVVEGHTDSQGTASYNQDLSQRRAQAVRDYLVTRGIASDRITAEGFGPTRSVADNTTSEGRANNRRVEIVVKPKM